MKVVLSIKERGITTTYKGNEMVCTGEIAKAAHLVGIISMAALGESILDQPETETGFHLGEDEETEVCRIAYTILDEINPAYYMALHFAFIMDMMQVMKNAKEVDNESPLRAVDHWIDRIIDGGKPVRLRLQQAA